MNLKLYSILLIVAAIFSLGIASCGSDDDSDEVVSSRAYKGHENDVDINAFCRVYPSAVGTRLDDCHTCHTGEMSGGTQVGNACDYCHELMLEQSGHTYRETLNAYGTDYMDQGRNIDAIRAIAALDSDGDSYTNEEEINANRHPGSDNSHPGQTVAPLKIVSFDQIQNMPAHEQFMLSNTTKQQFDDYVGYKGVKIADFLAALNIDTTGVTGLTVIAPDGYMKSFTIDRATMLHRKPIFDAGLDVATLGDECGFVVYPANMPPGLTDQGEIPGEHWMMIGYERDGMLMEPSYLDPVEGKINGEGPYRLVLPQLHPGLPDRGSRYSPTQCGDGYDYDRNKDHNAGDMVRGVMAIRIDPMPSGVEEFDYVNGGWAYIDAKQIVVYGHNVD